MIVRNESPVDRAELCKSVERLGQVLQSDGKFPEPESSLRDVLHMRREMFPAGSVTAARTATDLASRHRKR